MSSIIFLRNETQGLEGRIILSHGGRIFCRDLKPTDDPNTLFPDGKPDAIVAAYFAPLDELAPFIEDLTGEHTDVPIYLVAENTEAEAIQDAIQSGIRHAFQDPLDEEELLARLCVDTACADLAEGLDYEEWSATCTFLRSGSGAASTNDGPDQALRALEAERQELELERQILAEERQQLQQVPAVEGSAPISEEQKKVLDQRASELEEQRYEFEEQKIFLMDAQREVEAVQLEWEAERAELEKSIEDLKQQLKAAPGGAEAGDRKNSESGWLHSTIGSLPLAKNSRNQNGALSAAEAQVLKERLSASTESRRGLEAELEELSRSTALARAREVELEEEVIDLRRRYEKTGNGGVAAGGSLVERLERLSETHATILSDLEAIRTRRSTLALQIETLSSELANQEITEALTPAHLQRIREVKNQRTELQESDAALAAEESRSGEDLARNDQELLMIESWVEELETARTRIEELKQARIPNAESKSDRPSVEKSTDPKSKPTEATAPSARKGGRPAKTRHRKSKSGLSRRFALRGLA